MMKLMSVAVVAAIVGVVGVAFAQGPGWGPGGGMGYGRQAMWTQMQARMGGGPGGCGWAGGTAGAVGVEGTAVTEDRAREIATEYAAKYFKGFAVERVLPFQGRFRTAYQVELRGPKGEARALHVNPWGGVRPFGPLAAAQ